MVKSFSYYDGQVSYVNSINNIRPVITLKSGPLFTNGTGTAEDPWIVE